MRLLKNEPKWLIGFALALVLVAVIGVLASRVAPSVRVEPLPSPGKPTPAPIGGTMPTGKARAITQDSCEELGGTWNSCGSACRGMDDDSACIQVCVEQCECTSDTQCAAGYRCDMTAKPGVCLPRPEV